MKRQGEARQWLQQGEVKEPGKREDNLNKEKTIETRIGEVMSMRRRANWNTDGRSDIDNENKQGEEDRKKVKKQQEVSWQLRQEE